MELIILLVLVNIGCLIRLTFSDVSTKAAIIFIFVADIICIFAYCADLRDLSLGSFLEYIRSHS